MAPQQSLSWCGTGRCGARSGDPDSVLGHISASAPNG